MDAREEKISAQLVNEIFGQNLASIRRSRGKSQQDLGKVVGLSRGTISNLESGIQNVQLHQVYAFAFALDTPVSAFFPSIQDVQVFDDDNLRSDRIFLEFAKRQLIDISESGEDDENA